MSKQAQQPQWYHHINIDLLARVLARSVFHPAIVLIFYLCLAAVHKHRQPVAYYSLYWAGCLAAVDAVAWLNHRLTVGRARTVRWDDEVVVITGGAGGLGRVLADTLVRRGVRTAILDVAAPDGEAADLLSGDDGGGGDLVWQVCDVSQLDQVRRSIDAVVHHFGGRAPTILVNNAAASIHARPLVPPAGKSDQTLTPPQATKTLHVNTLGQVNVLHVCLPHLLCAPAGAHVVTVSSILAELAPARLADYAASKAAASALHRSLVHELAAATATTTATIKTLLVETGQLDTALFASVTRLPWYANFFAPVLDAKDVADAIVRVLSSGDGGVLRMPLYATLVGAGWYAVLPGSVQRMARWISGIDAAVLPSKEIGTIDGAKKDS